MGDGGGGGGSALGLVKETRFSLRGARFGLGEQRLVKGNKVLVRARVLRFGFGKHGGEGGGGGGGRGSRAMFLVKGARFLARAVKRQVSYN